ncbi:DUF6578 domain-containing protein [Actinopolymorpha sp. NPDC004070]|uniref:DUF6578 domain-containing protein n=1 Tax=Actinopolymorpha sp. NPDC004070 TaxID=3154548 RepID=UPI0033B55C9C
MPSCRGAQASVRPRELAHAARKERRGRRTPPGGGPLIGDQGDVDSLPAVRGKVRGVRAVYCRLEPSDDRLFGAVPGTTSMVDVRSGDGWEPARKGVELRGCLVDLRQTELVLAR